MTKETPSIRQINKFLRKLSLRNNDVILVKSGTAFAQHDAIDSLIQALQKTGLAGIVIGVVDDFDDIKVLREADLNKHGWYRSEQMSKVMKAMKRSKDEGEDKT